MPSPATAGIDTRKRIMKSVVLSALLLAVAGAAVAGPACNAPKEKWMPEAAFKKDVEAQGYQIKVSKGQCYEIYGTDKAGKKVEIYFDPVSGKAIEQK
jgi:hypothetical protein